MTVPSKVPEILLHLAAGGKSGVLRFQAAKSKKQLILKDGTIAFAESNQPDEHLARIMVSMSLLKQPDMREVVSEMKKGKNSEEAVASIKGIDGDAIRKAIHEQVMRILASVLAGNLPDMRFYTGEDLIKNRTDLGLDVPEALVSAARCAVSRRMVPMPSGFLQGRILAGKDWDAKRMELPLSETESYAFVRAHDVIPAPELLPLVDTGVEPPENVLLRLYVLGLIEPEGSQGELSGDVPESAESDDFLMAVEDILARFRTATLYEILGVGRDAGLDEIQNAYHKLARQYHPDRFQSEKYPGSVRKQVEEIFGCINQAYGTLKDPKLRSDYDKSGSKSESAAAMNAGSTTASEGEMIEELFLQGRQSLARGDFEKAEKMLKSCVHLRPDKSDFNYYLGLAESEIPRLYKSAEQHFLRAIELEQIPGDSHIALSRLYLKVHLPGKAAARLEEVLRWDPDHPKAKKLLEEAKAVGSSQ